VALVPTAKARPDSSLAYMMDALGDAWCDGRGGYYVDAEWRLVVDGFERALIRASDEGKPLLVAGTAFAFVHWLDTPGGRTLPPVPEGSVLMETGGFKGRSRHVSRAELYTALGDRLGLPTGRIVNEYGMTELLSQFYEPIIRDPAPDDISRRRHEGPPWIRTRVLDPGTLEAVPTGEPGLLAHFDLANLDSVSAVLTEDVGQAAGTGFHLRGRLAGAEPRGCSLAMEDLLLARGAVF
jgi:hypothetical protein